MVVVIFIFNIRQVEISYVYGYVYLKRDREICLCQQKPINAYGDAVGVGHSNMHYMPIHQIIH